MQNNIRNTNLRFNLDKEQQRRAWEYLQTMDRQDFKSYSQVISLALVDYFDRYYRTQADPYLETREREQGTRSARRCFYIEEVRSSDYGRLFKATIDDIVKYF